MNNYGNLIAGTVETTPQCFDVISPLDETLVGRQAICTPAQAERALNAAQAAAEIAREAPLETRASWLLRMAETIDSHASELQDLMWLEMGLKGGVSMAEFARYYPEEMRRHFGQIIPDHLDRATHYCTPEPVGVVVSFTAFNFPASQICFRIAAALATGNAVIIKASERTPMVASRIGELIAELDLPRGLVSILVGDPAAPGELMDTLAGSPIPRLLTLIGSTTGGLALMRAGSTSIKRFELELGGNAPVIIHDDAADLSQLAATLVQTKLANSGQVCVSPNRVYVHQSIYDTFVADSLAQMQSLSPATERGDTTGYGPVISSQSVARLEALVEDAVSKGAACLCGGRRAEGAGYFFQPTLLVGVTRDMRVYQEEVFGPILALSTFNDQDDVIAWANETDGGLAAYVFTQNLRRAMQAQQGLRYGTVQINQPGIWGYYLPHGGMGQSGHGKNHGYPAIDSYLDLKRTSFSLRG